MLKAAERQYGVIEGFGQCLVDDRQAVRRSLQTTFSALITVDKGGTNPIDTFDLDDLQVVNLTSGAYQMTWNASVGTNTSSSPSFWTFNYDGVDATWTMADFSSGFHLLSLEGATDNQGGSTSVRFTGIYDDASVFSAT